MIASNIPLHKLQNTNFRSFLDKYTHRHRPDESTLRKNYVIKCYTADILKKIRENIGSSFIYFCINETTDPRGKYVADFIVRKLNVDSPRKSYLLVSKILEKTNNNTIAQFVNDCLRILWPEGGNGEKVLLMLSDAAPYMVKAAKNLKPFYSNLIHVTCAAHGIHRIAENIMDIFHEINDLINNGKKIFLKAPFRIQLYYEMLPNKPLPPQLIITRCGAWLESAIFYADNFENFKNVIQSLQEDDVKSIKNCKQILTQSNIINDLTYIKTNFSVIVESIKKLETSGLLLIDALEIFEQVTNSINNFSGNENSVLILKKCSDIIKENKSLLILKEISKIHQGENVDLKSSSIKHFSPEMLSSFKYAPITSVDVEQSFSAYKHIVTNCRHYLTEINMKHIIVTYCFSNNE